MVGQESTVSDYVVICQPRAFVNEQCIFMFDDHPTPELGERDKNPYFTKLPDEKERESEAKSIIEGLVDRNTEALFQCTKLIDRMYSRER